MKKSIIDKEWKQFNPDAFEAATLLGAVEAVDKMRDHLNDGENGSPPELRTDLMRLHQMAMFVFNQGGRSQVAELFNKASELECQVDELMTSLEQIHETLSQLTALSPANLSNLGDAEAEIS